jgi:bifunctional non-homologous end joining protein LigD
MALEEYKRKRDFKQTPEPPPKLEKRGQNRFVVQKHRASHLHYDFRLEMDGVLKSWAIPKGPSLDPADKRLAMQVEDHPVSYFDFEGLIPVGNYGAGTVMVWDVGTWEPQGDAKEMLRKGDLKFYLSGQKLKGDFALIHLKARRPGSKGTEWLLIKHHDAYEQPGYDIDQFDSSALTKRSLKEIAGDEGAAAWESSRKATVRGGSGKNGWLAESIARVDAKRAKTAKSKPSKTSSRESTGGQPKKASDDATAKRTKLGSGPSKHGQQAILKLAAGEITPFAAVASDLKKNSTLREG